VSFHFGDLFSEIAGTFGNDLALVHGTQRLSWSEFHDGAVRVATFLASQGVGPGDKVGLLLQNSPEYLIAQYGAFLRRAVPINMNYRYLGEELAHLANDSGAKVVFAHEALASRLAGVRERTPQLRSLVTVPEFGFATEGNAGGDTTWADSQRTYDSTTLLSGSEDDVYMLYTGGTTGLPKGVMFRMGDFVRRMLTGYVYRGWDVPTAETLLNEIAVHRDRGDRRVSIPACPLMHGTGMWLGAFYAHLMGGCVVTLPGRSFDANALWSTAVAERADAVTIVGDAFAKPMLDALDLASANGNPYDLSSLRIIQSSGVMWSAEVQTGLLRHLDVRLVDSMGSTEGAMARRIVSRGTPIATARFEPLPGTKLIAEDGTIVPRDSSARGRIAASAVVPLGYFNDETKSAATFVEIDGVRHAMAGDWATWADDGTLVLLGRGSNCINTAGEKVFPEEVEEAMKRHPAVVDCLVIGLPDARFNESVAAVVSLEPTAQCDANAIVADVKTWLASYKLPRTVRIVPRIERAANGKADYGWAKEVLAGSES
jgi:3-oxocholest-4-en-26-oate---CoA ligase